MNRDLSFYMFGILVGFFGGLFIGLSAAGAVECAAKPDIRTPGMFWRYRVIDERQCWYRGDSALPKSALTWAPSEPETPAGAVYVSAPLSPVLVPTISYKPPVRPKESHPDAMLYIVVGVGFGLAFAGMVWPLRRRGRA